MPSPWKILSLAALFAAPAALALEAGDPAPALKTGKWIQGEPVAGFEKDKAYIVEFWATWCGPCRATIPHLNELHAQFKDQGLVVIGQNVWERAEEKVPGFVKKMGDKMTYRVALDDTSVDEKGAMAKTWMEAAGQDGIPAAFLVGKDGKIAWIGHPGELKPEMIAAVLKGEFDPKKAAEERSKAEEAGKAGRALFGRFIEAMREEKFDDALAAAADIEKSGDPRLASMGQSLRLAVYAEKKDFDLYHATVKEAAAKADQDSEKLNALAWDMVASPRLEKPDLALADRIASRAAELTKSENPAILDTLARVKFRLGEKAKAIELEKKAIVLAKDDAAIFKVTLGFYEKDELPTVRQIQDALRQAAKDEEDKKGEDV